MRIFLSVLILIFSLQSLIKADDISEFEIEGMSIGDSLLDFFSKNEILDALNNQPSKGYIYPSKKYRTVRFFSSKFDNYQNVNIGYIDKDNKFIIEHIMGVINYNINFSECFTKLNSVENSIDNLQTHTFKNKRTYFHNADPSGKSEITQVDYKFADGGIIIISCADWSNEIGITDALRVEFQSKNFSIFVKETYN